MSLFSSHNLILEKVVQGPAPQVDVPEVLSTFPTQGQTITWLPSSCLPGQQLKDAERGREGTSLLSCCVCVCVKQNRTLDVSFLPLMSSLPLSSSLLPGGLSSWTWVASLGLCQRHLAPSPLCPTSSGLRTSTKGRSSCWVALLPNESQSL